jgi:hypothetical protein
MNGRPTAADAGKIDVAGDLTVNRLGFGAMRITGPGIWGDPPDRDRAKEELRRAVELDVAFIDTADYYGPEVSERLIAETLYPYPEELVIATKGGLVRPGPGRWVPNGRPEHLRRACEGSLARLPRSGVGDPIRPARSAWAGTRTGRKLPGLLMCVRPSPPSMGVCVRREPARNA